MSGRGPLRALSGRRTIRLRLTATYSLLFVLAAAMLLAFTYVFVVRGLSTSTTGVSLSGSRIPHAPSDKILLSRCSQALKFPSRPDKNLILKCQQSRFLRGVSVGVASQRATAVHQLLLYSLIGLAIMGVLSAAVGWLVAGRALRPVQAITGAARRASQENLGERLALDGPDDELKELADTYDAMLTRLDRAFASQRRFVADASHELRTPLTVMRTAIDVTLAKPGRTAAQLEDMAREVRQAAERAEALIEALLTLARSDRGVSGRDPADLATLAEDAIDAAGPQIRERALRVQPELWPAATCGDRVLIDRLVANLVDNAVRHNAAGGWLRVATGTRDDTAYLIVANGGPLIPDAEAPQLLEPFRRRNGRAASAPGTGLGLSIVRSVAAAHHGEVAVRSGPAGGLEVTVQLPVSPDSRPGAGAGLGGDLSP